MGAQQADDRRVQMLRAAVDVIADRGFPETRVADVAARAAASPALVLYYFGTKDRLLTEALRYSEDVFYAEIARRLLGIGSARKRLEELVRASCQPEGVGGLPGSWLLWFDLWAQASRHPEVSRDREQLDQRWRDTISDIVYDGQQRGEFERVDSEEFAILLSALLDGLAVQIALGDPLVDEDRAFNVAMRLAASYLGFSWARRPARAPRRRSARRAPAT